MSELDPHRTARPGPVAWVVIAAGWVVMGVAVVGMYRDPLLGSPGSWATWVVGAAVVHDAVVLPIVVGVGWIVGRVLPSAWRTPWRVVLVVGAVISLVTYPIARRWGARADNPSILPLDVARHLLVLLGILAVAAVVAGILNSIRIHRQHTTDHRQHTAGESE